LIDSPFIKLNPYGVKGYLRWTSDADAPYKCGPHYGYIEVPLQTPMNENGNKRLKLKAGETYNLVAAGTIEVAPKYHALVQLTPWWRTRTKACVSMFMVEPEDGLGQITLRFTPSEDIDLTPEVLDHGLVRIYALA
jgi:hypothetical protein